MPGNALTTTSRTWGFPALASGLLGAAALVCLATTVVLGLDLPPSREQGDYSRLIAIHPPLAWVSYLAFGVTGLASALYLWRRRRRWDQLAGASAEIGLLFTALMLVTGSIWGRPTWGVWWVWDARLTLSALMLALLLGYLALRRLPLPVDRRSRISAISALAMVLVIPVNHFAVTWWRTLHQGRSLANRSPGSELDGVYIEVMLFGLFAMTLVYAWLLLHRYRVEQLEERLEEEGLARAIEERRREGVLTP
jgi:heme exporter protein C